MQTKTQFLASLIVDLETRAARETDATQRARLVAGAAYYRRALVALLRPTAG